jgi:hypothetical protein
MSRDILALWSAGAYLSLSFSLLGCLVIGNDVYDATWHLVDKHAFGAFHRALEGQLGSAILPLPPFARTRRGARGTASRPGTR